MIVIDSSVWVDYFRGRRTPETAYLDMTLGTEIILIDDLILTEVLQGFREDVQFEKARAALNSLEHIVLLDTGVAAQSAQNFRRLRCLGITVRKTIDCIIATGCIENRLPLLHADRDFDPFEQHLGLIVVHP